MKLNKYIDHTLLKQDASQEQIDRLLSEAHFYHYFLTLRYFIINKFPNMMFR